MSVIASAESKSITSTIPLGVNRFSIYAEFGSKQALFDAVLQRYDAEAVEFGSEYPSGAGFVKRYFKRLSAAFESAIDYLETLQTESPS